MKHACRTAVPTFLAPLASLLSVAALAGMALAQDPASAPERPAPAEQSGDAQRVERQGGVVEGSVNPYSFDPKAREEDESLRRTLEDMGPDAIAWFQHVQTLSNPFFEGRAPGSRGSELTHEYVEFWFRKIGLEPAFPADSASENWTLHRQSWLLPGSTVEVKSATVTIDSRSLERGKDFEVMGNSGSGTVTAPLAFAGYGIEDGPDGYTSFTEGADFTGRVVVLLRYEPLNAEGKSRWSPRRFSEHSAIAGKVAAIAKRSPAAILLVNPPGAVDGRTMLESTDSSAFGRALDIPFIQLSQPQADELLKSADPESRSLEALRAACDEGGLLCFNMRGDRPISIDVAVEPTGTTAANIGGVVRGRGSLADEWVVIGGHLDHVGYGEFGTSPAFRGQLHPGADDNASGTAALIVLARRLNDWMRSDEAPADARSLLFLAFDAEESGLRGSREFTRTPTLKLDSIQAMLNLDMVGRMRNDELVVSGVGTAEGFLELLRPSFDASGLTIHADPTGRGPSDHANFYSAGVPVLFLYTGSHEDYHRPTDFGYRTNPAGAVKAIDLTQAIATQLATQPAKLKFESTSSTAGRDRGYASVRLGIQPGLLEDGESGVKVEAVSAGTSAADAGIEPGDVLLAWNGAGLESVGAMMEMLRTHKPGDVVTLRVRRGSESIEVPVTLKPSARRPQE